MTLANKITIFRILLIPFFVGALLYYSASAQEGVINESYRLLAVAIFILASISDGIDGFVARKFNQHSRLGAFLDPLADKILILSAIVTFGVIQVETLYQLPIWFVIVVLSKDAIMVLGYLIFHLFVGDVHVQPHWSGKGATFLLMVLVAMILFLVPASILFPMVIICAAFIICSTVVYVFRWITSWSEEEQEE